MIFDSKTFCYLVALLTSMFVSGCAHLSGSPAPTIAPKPAQQATPPQAKIPSIPFSKETLYDLLVAEFAGKRDRADLALGNYLKQAHKTRDPGVAARATRIANYIGAHQATLDSAMLWVEIEPQNLQAKQIAASELIQAGKTSKAIGLIEELVAADKQVNFEFLLQGLKSSSSGERGKLLKRLQNLSEQHPQNEQLWFTIGAIQQVQQQPEAALYSFSKAIEANPNYSNAILAKARQLAILGRQGEAMDLMRQASQRFPADKRIGVTYARLLIDNKKLIAAQTEFSRLASRYPNDSALVLSLGLIAWENKQPALAKTQLNRLLDMGKQLDDAHTYLGRIAGAENDLPLAIQHFQKVGRGPLYAQAKVQLALAYAQSNKLDKAEQLLKQARLDMPKNSLPFYLAEANILHDSGEPERALKLLNQALQQHPKDLSLLYMRAMLNEQLKQFSTMETDLQHIIQLKPDHTAALNALGYSYADRNIQMREAQRLIERAFALEPNNPAIIDSLGWLHYRLGNSSKALQFLQSAYKKLPNAEIAAHLGEVLWVSGQQQQASQIWSQALQKSPDSKILKQTMKRFIP